MDLVQVPPHLMSRAGTSTEAKSKYIQPTTTAGLLDFVVHALDLCPERRRDSNGEWDAVAHENFLGPDEASAGVDATRIEDREVMAGAGNVPDYGDAVSGCFRNLRKGPWKDRLKRIGMNLPYSSSQGESSWWALHGDRDFCITSPVLALEIKGFYVRATADWSAEEK